MTTEEIQHIYQNELRARPFPHEAIRTLPALAKRENLTPELARYFASVAGLASGDHWKHWPKDEIQRWRDYLSHDIYFHVPELNLCRGYIDAENTPRLYRCINASELAARELMPHLESVLATR